jgi:hypothetical protein
MMRHGNPTGDVFWLEVIPIEAKSTIELIIRQNHNATQHSGVEATMSLICRAYHIPKLRVLIKKFMLSCLYQNLILKKKQLKFRTTE